MRLNVRVDVNAVSFQVCVVAIDVLSMEADPRLGTARGLPFGGWGDRDRGH
jgi:hypothetical protein